MNCKQSLLTVAILTSLSLAAQAQQADSSQTSATDLDTVTVVGIRGSVQKSLDSKRDANSHVEVVSAEDIGKLPAKNVADTLQRVPGVNISSSSATEGGFDESDRVSLRGTAPSLTQTLVNGHTIGTGDWFVLSQVQTVGRSVSYSLLPAEIVDQVVVHKSSEAKLAEGGSAGSVDIITRRPLDFAEKLTIEATGGMVYSDLPSDFQPQFNALFNFKNDAGSFGVLVQPFFERRSLRRDGQEVVGGFGTIAADAPVTATNPDLAGVKYPNLLGATLFEQERTRKGGVVDIQFKPTDNLTLGLNGFYSKMEADNYNRNYMMWTSQFAGTNAPLPGYTVEDGVLTHAVYPAVPGSTTPYGVYDQISRQGAESESKYLTADMDWQVSDRFRLKAQAGYTEGHGRSDTQDVIELGTNAGAGASWDVNGVGSPLDWSLGGDNATPSGILPSAGWIFGGQDIDALDKEKWAQADGQFFFTDGALSTLDFGVRYTEHTRENDNEIAQGPLAGWTDLANFPVGSYQNYPRDFGNGIGGTYPAGIWYWTPAQLAAFDAQWANRDPVARFYWQDLYSVKEKNWAGYVQANFSGESWSGNVGVRYVRTEQDTVSNVAIAPSIPTADQPTGTINGSAFGPYLPTAINKTYDKFLPSLNFKYSFSDELVARFAASQTLTRPDYSALAGSVSLDDLTHSGSGGNPDLDPLVSTNVDAALEWYFMPRGLLSLGVYNMDLKDYVAFGTVSRQYIDQAASAAAGQEVYADYNVSIPVNIDAKVKGVEVAYEQPLGEHFGLAANYTYADSEADGGEPVFGTSKSTYNLSGYFENDNWNARVSYTYRTEFFAGVSRTDDFYQKAIGNLAASLGYKINDYASISLDGLNLNNPKLKYYADVDGQHLPYAFYSNGRQYYLNFRLKF